MGSRYYLKAHTGQSVLSSLNCLSTIVVNAGMITGDTLWEPSFVSWLLAMISEEGKRTTFFHWPKLNTVFANQAWISLRRLPEAKAGKKAVLKVRSLRSVSFIGSKGILVSSFSTTERFHFGTFQELLGRYLRL